MQRKGLSVRLGFCAVLVLSLLALPAGAQNSVAACDRSCLEGFAEQLLLAFQAHDPSGLALTRDVKYTENGQRMGLNDGLWQTFSKNSSYRLPVVDVHAGQLVFLGVIEENGVPVIAHFRLRIQNRQISEIEVLLARNARFAKLDNLQQPRPIFLQTLAPEQRRSRAQMQAITNSYFSGLDEENSGANVPFDDQCQRQENGAILANSPDPDAGAMQKLGCKAQFDTGFSVIVTDIRERRFMVIDEERGLSYAIVFFDHNGTPKMMGTAEGTQRAVSAPFNRPLTFMIGELFKIVDGKIRQIEAVIVDVPYGMPSGWNGEDLRSTGQL
ncbi:MAG: hypothetical protein RQ899_10475 [Pseudomonadales bacterium]|nr:hypothetical protein [Pseudomonadales bacterium]